MFRLISVFQAHLSFSEISTSATQGSLMAYQPFMDKSLLRGCDTLLLKTAQKDRTWTQWLSAEQTAFALGQVTTARALPPLNKVVTIATLLDSRLRLRDYFDDRLVDAITNTLANEGESLQWKQVEATSYACVIGAGAAACIETTEGDEILYLRYANQIAEAISQAQNETDLPRSILGLQIHLQECIDQLLAYARSKTLRYLVG